MAYSVFKNCAAFVETGKVKGCRRGEKKTKCNVYFSLPSVDNFCEEAVVIARENWVVEIRVASED